MPEKPIQEQFGQRVIDAFAEFARSDLKTPTELENDEFSHVTNATQRRRKGKFGANYDRLARIKRSTTRTTCSG